jgi:predicted PurR-regulated permease PerM
MTPAIAERDRVLLVIYYAVVLAVGYLAFQVIGPFLAALAWAAVVAMVLYPLHARLAARTGRPALAATLTTVVAGLLIVGPAIGILTILLGEVTAIFQRIQDGSYAMPASPDVQALYARLRHASPLPLPEDLTSIVTDGVRSIATFVAGSAGALLQNVAALVFQLFVMLFGVFYFLRDGDRMVGVIRRLLPFEPERRDEIVSRTHELVVATVGSTFAVAITQGALSGLTLGLLGFHAPVFWGVMTAFTSLLPAIGSGLVWGPAAVYLFATGDVVRGVILLVVATCVIGLADNILRPILLAGKTTLHGLLVFISLMGGVAAFGFIGLVVGPVALATLETLLGAVMDEPPAPAPPSAGTGAV